jgi:hypothetical protein
MKTSLAAQTLAAPAVAMAVTMVVTMAMTLVVMPAHAQKQRVPGCDELVWSAQVMEVNPDIRLSCQGVYSRGGDLFAKVTIEVSRVQGHRMSFRPLHVDGSKGPVRSVTVPNSWRVMLDGQSMRVTELLPGQRLNVYMPQDRFALTIDDSALEGEEELLTIE